MTEHHHSNGENARRIVDALADLFEAMPPGDRAAAEDELRDAGRDPARIAARTVELVAAARPTVRPRPVVAVAAARQRAMRAPSAQPTRRIWQGAAQLAAVLIAGIAVGWMAARILAPLPHVPLDRLAANPLGAPAKLPSGGGEGPGDDTQDTGHDGGPSRAVEEGAPPQSAPADGDEIAVANADSDGDAGQVDVAPAPVPPDEMANVETAANGDRAAVATSWTLNGETWASGRGLLPEPMLERVRSGNYSFVVQEISDDAYRARYGDGFWSASEANADHLAADGETCSLREADGGGFPRRLDGLPFPAIAAHRTSAACEAMWNTVAARSIAGGVAATVAVDHFARGARPQRLQAEVRTAAFLSQPAAPERLPDDLLSAARLRVIAPAELAEADLMALHYSDAAVPDSRWIFVRRLRQVRRIGNKEPSLPLAGTALGAEDLDCFEGKLEEFRWRVVGQQPILAPIVGAATRPARIADDGSPTTIAHPITAAERGEASASGWQFVDNLTTVPRPAWVIEGTPRDPAEGKAIGRVVLYVDAVMFRIYWKLVYGQNGRLAKDVMCAQQWWRSEDRSVGLATTAALSIVDDTNGSVTLARATAQTPELGTADRETFTIRALIDAQN